MATLTLKDRILNFIINRPIGVVLGVGLGLLTIGIQHTILKPKEISSVAFGSAEADAKYIQNYVKKHSKEKNIIRFVRPNGLEEEIEVNNSGMIIRDMPGKEGYAYLTTIDSGPNGADGIIDAKIIVLPFVKRDWAKKVEQFSSAPKEQKKLEYSALSEMPCWIEVYNSEKNSVKVYYNGKDLTLKQDEHKRDYEWKQRCYADILESLREYLHKSKN